MYKWVAMAGLALAATLHMSASANAAVVYQVSNTKVVNCGSPASGHGLWTNNLISSGHCPNYFSIDSNVSSFTLFNDNANPSLWTGSLSAVASNPGGVAAEIEILFSGYEDTHTGYKQEGGGPYDPNADNPDINFFSMATGTIDIAGLGIFSLAADPFEADTYFQFGPGANAKSPDEFGGSTWLRIVGPNGFVHAGSNHWDLNLTFEVIPPPPPFQIPVPSAALLFGFGLAGLGFTARSRRRPHRD